MTLPEISAVVRAAAATVKAHRRLRQGKEDEASEAAMGRLRTALSSALEAQGVALDRLAASARRPNDPIDLEKAFAGAVRVLGALHNGARELRGAAKRIIDVEVE